MQIFISMLSGQDFPLQVQPYSKILNIKRKICVQEKIPPQNQILLFSGKRLQDDLTLEGLQIQEGSRIYLLPTSDRKQPTVTSRANNIKVKKNNNPTTNENITIRDFSPAEQEQREDHRNKIIKPFDEIVNFDKEIIPVRQHHLRILPGLNLEGICKTGGCYVFKQRIIYNNRFKNFYSTDVNEHICCPVCFVTMVPLRIGLTECMWKYEGSKVKNGNVDVVSSNWITVKNEYCIFGDGDNWNKLVVFVKPLGG